MTADPLVVQAVERITAASAGLRPRVGMVLGSGIGPLADDIVDAVTLPYAEIPDFPVPSVAGHGGDLVLGKLGGVDVACMRGRGHYYEGHGPAVMRTPVRTLKALGCEILILTNAAGSLRTDAGAGSLMLITDHINFSGTHPLIGETGNERFVALGDAYDAELRRGLLTTAAELGLTLHEGVYMWFSGPSFETPAEICAAGILGADAVGMSTVPEVILARHCGLRVAAISNITNLAAGLSEETLSHDMTMAMADKGAESLTRLLTGYLESMAAGS